VLSRFANGWPGALRNAAIPFFCWLAGVLPSGPVLCYLKSRRMCLGDYYFRCVKLLVAINPVLKGSPTLRFAEIRGHGKMVRICSIGAMLRHHRHLSDALIFWAFPGKVALLFAPISIVPALP